MSTKKKTGDKLVASIRKSKTGTVAGKTSERPDTTEAAAESKPATTRSVKKSATNKPASTVATNQDRRNYFSHGPRVWPD